MRWPRRSTTVTPGAPSTTWQRTPSAPTQPSACQYTISSPGSSSSADTAARTSRSQDASADRKSASAAESFTRPQCSQDRPPLKSGLSWAHAAPHAHRPARRRRDRARRRARGCRHRHLRAGEYLLLRGENPRIADLKAHNLPRKTDGYAPRCLVAEAIASEIQRALQDGKKAPRTVSTFGAQWSSGKWRCRYPGDRASCKKKGKPKQRITMRLV